MRCLLQNCTPPYGNTLSLCQKVTGNKKKELKWGGEGEEGKKRLNNTMAKNKSSDRGRHTASAGTTKVVRSPLPSPAQEISLTQGFFGWN